MRKTIVSAICALAVGIGPFAAPAFAGPSGNVTPDQDEHRDSFINDEACDPNSAEGQRHPWEQWVKDEWDRYNGTTSFTNTSDRPITFSLEVTEGVNESVSAMSSGNTWDVFLSGVKNRYGIVETSEWSVGDKLGPVTVKPGETVRADYGVHMKEFIGRVRTCDKRTQLWRTERYFGEYHGKGPSTRFVVWHRTTKEGDYRQNYVPVAGNKGSQGDSGPGAATIDGK
ncbi:hypothetical protein ACUY3K_09355 [Corynebacterium uberis]|uniref:hypothetical protein n=1 Tax=Corynebacterium TaxID=1716 RepID=UPI001D0B0CF8|nr:MULTISPECIES: hypothetical protein [Corynebacterium]MCZ9309403.1 hypothetical protein [Corynebacterium sp. c6VSa_13]UDL72953.1 hypothetical protein LH391_07465 [Corynebacterium uberis]UDL76170.1 hypothetical protein LH393_01925 [Corynebacterium uberis]UDL78382.1 hypothetical protein LH394_01920 [Corynebacterium uberis]UDL80665.1 hypothetical protein LH392_02350 [Corynebacterium uberis]